MLNPTMLEERVWVCISRALCTDPPGPVWVWATLLSVSVTLVSVMKTGVYPLSHSQAFSLPQFQQPRVCLEAKLSLWSSNRSFSVSVHARPGLHPAVFLESVISSESVGPQLRDEQNSPESVVLARQMPGNYGATEWTDVESLFLPGKLGEGRGNRVK